MKLAWRQILSTWKKGPGMCATTISKDSFPYLLFQLHGKLEQNGLKNLIAGFQKTGIYAINKDVVLKTLPQTTISPRKVNDTVSQAFVSFLEVTRASDTPTVRRVRRKLNVPAGKSIGCSDVQ